MAMPAVRRESGRALPRSPLRGGTSPRKWFRRQLTDLEIRMRLSTPTGSGTRLAKKQLPGTGVSAAEEYTHGQDPDPKQRG